MTRRSPQDPVAGEVFIIAPEFGEKTAVFSTQAHDMILFDIAWSPDAKWLAIAVNACQEGQEQCLDSLILLDATTREVIWERATRIGFGTLNWSPDSASVSYGSAWDHDLRTSTFEIVDLDGGCRTHTVAQGPLGWLDWSADGSKIAFIGYDGLYAVASSTLFDGSFWETRGGTCP